MYFEYVKNLLQTKNSNKKIYWHYSVLAVAEILDIENNKILFSDIENNIIELSKKEFNSYNKGCKPDEIFEVD